ncbi:hypothetical protein WSM22_03040 [Cytophagales bacterium WSM2-2]|nr:hypothetical protein WSM22_03040 [Cytophagales bacterium WSM2-2]
MAEEVDEFEADTIVRIKRTGEFARIKRRCRCTPTIIGMHYDGWVNEENPTIVVLLHEDLEFECAPRDKFKP